MKFKFVFLVLILFSCFHLLSMRWAPTDEEFFIMYQIVKSPEFDSGRAYWPQFDRTDNTIDQVRLTYLDLGKKQIFRPDSEGTWRRVQSTTWDLVSGENE